MIQCLELSKELILIVRILDDDLYKVNVFLDDSNQEVIALLQTAPDIFFLQIHGSEPCFKHRSQNAQIVATIAHFLHMTAKNDPLTQTNVLGQLSQLFIVDDSRKNTGQETLSLTWVSFGDIGCNHETQYAIAEIFQLFIVAGSERNTIIGARGNDDFFSVF